MDKYKKLFSNTLIFALGTFGSKLMMFVLLFFYTYVLTLEQFSTIDIIIQAANLLIPIAGLSIYEGTVRFSLDRENNRTDVFSISLQVALMGLAGVLVIFPLLLFVKSLSDYLFLLYLYIFTGTIKVVTEQFVRGRGLVRLFAVNGLLTTFNTIVFNVLLLVVLDLGIIGYIMSIVLADMLSLVFLFWAADLRKYMRFNGVNKRLRRAMLRYSLPMLPATIMWWVTSFSDRYMILYMLGDAHNGVYGTAYKIPTIITLISAIFSQAWQISAVTEHNDKRVARFYTNVFDTYQSLVYVIAGGILLFIKPVSLLMSESFSISYLYTPFLVLSVVCSCFVNFLGSVYVATKRTKRGLLTTAVPATINIALNIALIPVFGITGAAMATFISYAVAFIIRIFDARAIIGIGYSWNKIGLNFCILYAMCYFVLEGPSLMYLFLAAGFVAIAAINFKAVVKAVLTILSGYLKKLPPQKAQTPAQ